MTLVLLAAKFGLRFEEGNMGLAGCLQAVGVNPRDWLTDVLLRVGWQKPSQMDELLPARWAAEGKLNLVESSEALEV